MAFQIYERRKGRMESKHAEAYLRYICGKPGKTRFFLLALAAEAGDETMPFIRFLDEDFDNRTCLFP